jgi:hypothetical protein
MKTDLFLGLPEKDAFKDVVIPEFDRKYYRTQGPASTVKNKKGRLFSAGGPKADLIVQIILSDMGLTRRQIAKIAECSPSRVSEVIWAMEAAVKTKQLESVPEVPRAPRQDDEAVEETSDEQA